MSRKFYGVRPVKRIGNQLHLRCARCKEFFPASGQYFLSQPFRKYGFGSYCHKCRLNKGKPLNKKQAERLINRQSSAKSRAKGEVSLIEFSKLLDLIIKGKKNGKR